MDLQWVVVQVFWCYTGILSLYLEGKETLQAGSVESVGGLGVEDGWSFWYSMGCCDNGFGGRFFEVLG